MPKLNNTKFGILLIKPTKKNTYIRKVTNWAFDNFKALCLVNKQNIVTQIATDGRHGVQQAQVLDEYLKRILGNKRVELEVRSHELQIPVNYKGMLSPKQSRWF